MWSAISWAVASWSKFNSNFVPVEYNITAILEASSGNKFSTVFAIDSLTSLKSSVLEETSIKNRISKAVNVLQSSPNKKFSQSLDGEKDGVWEGILVGSVVAGCSVGSEVTGCFVGVNIMRGDLEGVWVGK